MDFHPFLHISQLTYLHRLGHSHTHAGEVHFQNHPETYCVGNQAMNKQSDDSSQLHDKDEFHNSHRYSHLMSVQGLEFQSVCIAGKQRNQSGGMQGYVMLKTQTLS